MGLALAYHPHRALPHFTDLPGTVRRPTTQCPTEKNRLFTALRNSTHYAQIKSYLSGLAGELDLFFDTFVVKVFGREIF